VIDPQEFTYLNLEKMKIKVKSKASGDKYILIPENLLEISLLEDISKVFERYKDRELQELVTKLLNND